MNQLYNYTAEDMREPVYCIGCRVHLPRQLAEAGRGLCPTCIAKINAPVQPPIVGSSNFLAPPPIPRNIAAPPIQNQARQQPPPPPAGSVSRATPTQSTEANKWWIVGGISLFAYFVIIGVIIPAAMKPGSIPPPPEKTPAEIALQQKIDAENAEEARIARAERLALQAEEKKRGKKPVPSAWDGITPEVNSYLKKNLKDPGSLRLDECSDVIAYGPDAWGQRVRYRAKNSFGGYILSNQLFIIQFGSVVNVIDLE